jgi:hypothetical protein
MLLWKKEFESYICLESQQDAQRNMATDKL